ncbi:hypothetical protein BDY19DRAFT_262570 [Irpex rosettiformis]|uniref:Uncharacterized protein n=1 Tax=Irpex rosettiformis TaxID=378272 RepID=A0ACB8UH54_9APHY|nr:hypothetical protein BDY19DRAFT_262570 [Irpex rosettiformis]
MSSISSFFFFVLGAFLVCPGFRFMGSFCCVIDDEDTRSASFCIDVRSRTCLRMALQENPEVSSFIPIVLCVTRVLDFANVISVGRVFVPMSVFSQEVEVTVGSFVVIDEAIADGIQVPISSSKSII